MDDTPDRTDRTDRPGAAEGSDATGEERDAIAERTDALADLSNTVETYESVADRYRERHADRGGVRDQRERFLDALGVGSGTAPGDGDSRGPTAGDSRDPTTGDTRGRDGGEEWRGPTAGEEWRGPTAGGGSSRDPTAERPRVLDVGCGPGWETAHFAERGCSVLAIDLTPSFLEATRERTPGADVALMDMRRPGVESNSIAGIWACASFLHVPREEAPATMRAFARVLRPGGVLNCSVKRGTGAVTGDTYEGDHRRFTLYEPGELRELVRAAGLRVERLDADEWVVVLARAPE